MIVNNDIKWFNRHSDTDKEWITIKRTICSHKRIELHKWDWLIVLTEDDALEYVITLNSYVTPSEHLLSLHPSVFWISRMDQMQQISNSVKHIVIQGCVGRRGESFNLSNLDSLITLEMGHNAYWTSKSIVFDSMNDWMIDEWDLIRLQSIILENVALAGNKETVDSNELIMKSMIDIDIDDEIFLLSYYSKEMVTTSYGWAKWYWRVMIVDCIWIRHSITDWTRNPVWWG